MPGLVVFVLFVSAALGQTIDKTVFKNCSRVEYCTRLRNNEPDTKSQFSAQLSEISTTENIITIPLKNENGDNLILEISMLDGNKIRAKVKEPESTRFELGDIVIIEDLKLLDVSQGSVINNKTVTFLPSDEKYPYQVQVMKGPPFYVLFSYNEESVVILHGDKLTMENTKESQVFTFRVEFPDSKRLYGLHDHAYSMSLGVTNNNTDTTMDPFRLRNSDSWGYEANSPMALYGARPVIFGHSEKKTSAIFLHNAAEQWIDTNSGEGIENPSAYFMVNGGAFDLFVLLGPKPANIVRQFTGLTGTAHLPQIWALGYHQCRFSYKSQDDVKDVVANLDKYDFPFDAIWIDGDHTDDYRWFHWNHTTYPDPIEMQNNISATGRVCVTISDPHIAVDENYETYVGAKDKYFVKMPTGEDYVAECWPGNSSWIDYMVPEASDYYSSWFSYEKFNGSTPTLAGIWNDMNEPAVFDETIEKTMPWEALHNGTVKHGDVHNIYGLMHVRSTHKGLLDRDNHEKRPFILTRSHFAGSQRYAAVWTGDNSATWDHFANTYSQCMIANLMGMVLCGADIGGFIGDPTEELVQRWYQGAVWLPFFRGHSSRESRRREPYLFGEDVQTVLRNTLRLRYRHIPSFYTLFFEHTRTGDPIIRPLYYQYPEVFDLDTQVLVGTDIMGVAVTKPNVSTVPVYFPGTSNDYWFRIDNDSFEPVAAGQETKDVAVTINSSPVYYRAGSIVCIKDVIRKSAVAALDDPYTLHINLNKEHEASGRLYVDDFYSFKYRDTQAYLYVNITYITETGGLMLETIDGNSTGFNFIMDRALVHSIEFSDEGELKTTHTEFTKTANGVPLIDINIGEALMKSNSVFIKLE